MPIMIIMCDNPSSAGYFIIFASGSVCSLYVASQTVSTNGTQQLQAQTHSDCMQVNALITNH
jgi:hypothetical protein